MQSLFRRNTETDSISNENEEKADISYRVWFAAVIITVALVVWRKNNYELFAKVAWTVMGPGFTFSQVWKERHDLLSSAVFGALLLVHFGLIQILYPYLPVGRYGYILLIAIAEIMTIGLAYQVWLHLRSKKSNPFLE